MADTFQDTLEGVNQFISVHRDQVDGVLKAIEGAAEQVTQFVGHTTESTVFNKTATMMGKAEKFFTEAQEIMLLQRLGCTFDSLSEAASLFSRGEGTLGRLANSDCLYAQLTTVLCQLKTVLSDITNYGLLLSI